MRKEIKYGTGVYIAIGIGGMIGTVSRYSLSLIVNNPMLYATLFVNLIGCFLLTYIINNRSIQHRFTPEIITALTVGTIGSFTTFSTFMFETIEMWQVNIFYSICYVFISIFGGLLFSFLGYQLSTKGECSK